MRLKFNRRKLRDTRETPWLILDLVMVFLVLVNLAFIVFDTLYGTDFVSSILDDLVPDFSSFYGARIHPHFLFYDLVFIGIFFAVFMFEWVVAVRRETYPRWYFFPFMRWYDLLSLIPVGTLRLLRLLRVVSLLLRLHKSGIIDLTDSRVYRFFEFYLNVFIDEITDRVIVRTLDDVKREVQDDTPIARQIITEVIAPRKDELVAHLSRRIGVVAEQSYARHKLLLRRYVESVIADAVDTDAGIRSLQRVPVLGRHATETIRQSIRDIVYQVFDRVIRDVSTAEQNRLVDEAVGVLIESFLEEHPDLGDIGQMSSSMAVEVIEVIKDRVRVQHWKENLERRKKNAAKMPT
jgi:hypothetical protein